MHRSSVAGWLCAIVLAAAPAPAASTPLGVASGAAPGADGQPDPFAPVYILTSRETYQRYVRTLAPRGLARFDSAGRALVLARVREHQLADISHYIHEEEHRCGGYFAFDSAEAAEAFLHADRTREALLATVSYAIDNPATVMPWLPQASEAAIYDTIDHLSTGYRNRYYASSLGLQSATWIRDHWLSLAGGRSDVTAELFTDCTNCSTQPSVILTVAGTDLADEVVVLGGHLDSISNSGFGEFMLAPGADDDASGIATLTEVIRVAVGSGWRPRRTVKFMGYAAEEVGLRGSQAIASRFAEQGVDVVGALQLDMTNYKSGPVEDMQLITDYSNPALQDFMTGVFDTYLAPLGYNRGTDTCGYACSDHASWTAAGYPSGMMFEAGDVFGHFPYIHTSSDTLGMMGESAAHSVKFAQFGLAFLGEMAKTAFPGDLVPKLPECDGREREGASLLPAPASGRFVQGALPARARR